MAKNGEQEELMEEQPVDSKQTGDNSKTTIIVAKNRNGKTGNFDLMFQKSFSRFTEPTNEFQEKQAAMYRSADLEYFDPES